MENNTDAKETRETTCTEARVSLVDRQVGALAPDALGPAQIEAKAEKLAVAKSALPDSKCFVLAVFAGAFIACGGAFFGLVMSDASIPFIAQRCLGGLCFCLGLQLVLCCGAELFTGNALMICGAKSGKISWSAMLHNWLLVWAGNFVGALLAAFVLYLANLQGMNSGAVGDAFVSVAAGKVSLSWATILFKGIACNVLVCLAVWIGFGARTIADKVLGILLPITAFVAMGFEHCVANMFFFAMGLACRVAGFGDAVAGVERLDIGGICYNLAFSTLGNVIGGALLVGLGYWYAYRKGTDRKNAAQE